MLQNRSWILPPPLAEHVSDVWRIKGEGNGALDWILPDVTGASIALHLGGPGRLLSGGAWAEPPVRFVVGSLSRALPISHAARADTVGIQLPPGCACLLGVPAATLVDLVAPLSDIAPALDRDLALWSEAFIAKRSGLEELLRILAAHIKPRCDAVARRAARALFRVSDVSVSRLAEDLSLSRRHLDRRFHHAIGRAPREFRRLARFSRAWQRACLAPVESWASLALDAGYFDQAHMIRDFRDFVGETPTRVFSNDWYEGISRQLPEHLSTPARWP